LPLRGLCSKSNFKREFERRLPENNLGHPHIACPLVFISQI
jgi:hypothetical protein